jgi:hypothetical protein
VLEEDVSDKRPFAQDGRTSLREGRLIRRNQLRTLKSVDDLVVKRSTDFSLRLAASVCSGEKPIPESGRNLVSLDRPSEQQ